MPQEFSGSQCDPGAYTACFSVVADVDANTISRVLEPFTKRGLVPGSIYAVRAGRKRESLHIDVQLPDTDAETARRIAHDIRGLYLVDTVLTSEKRYFGDAVNHGAY